MQQSNTSNISNTPHPPEVPYVQRLVAEATAAAEAHTLAARVNRLPRLRDYLAFRAIPLDAQQIIGHFEQLEDDDEVIEGMDPFALEEDFTALLDRFEERLGKEFLPTRQGRRQTGKLFEETVRELLTHIEMGRINAEGIPGDDYGAGSILEILAGHNALFGGKRLRYDEEIPLLIERWLWHVEPGETHETCPALALVREWILRTLH